MTIESVKDGNSSSANGWPTSEDDSDDSLQWEDIFGPSEDLLPAVLHVYDAVVHQQDAAAPRNKVTQATTKEAPIVAQQMTRLTENEAVSLSERCISWFIDDECVIQPAMGRHIAASTPKARQSRELLPPGEVVSAPVPYHRIVCRDSSDSSRYSSSSESWRHSTAISDPPPINEARYPLSAWPLSESSLTSLSSTSTHSSSTSSFHECGKRSSWFRPHRDSWLEDVALFSASCVDKSFLASTESLEDGDLPKAGCSRKCGMVPVLTRYCDPSLSYLDRVVLEIIETEQTYVRDLEQIVQGYLKYLSNGAEENLLEKVTVETLFNNIGDIYQFNRKFLEEISQCCLDPVLVARAFVKHKEGFSIYTQYCTSYPRTVSLLKQLMCADTTASLLKERQAALGHPLPLGSYLLKPVQRILKYHLLLQNIVKHYSEAVDGYGDIVTALATMTGIARHINMMKRRHEHAVRVQEIQSLLYNWQGKDLMTYGELVAEGTFRLYGAKGARHAFLFEKMFLMVKKKEEGSLIYKVHILCSNLMLIESVPCNPLCFHVIPFDNPRVQYTLQARSVEEKREWTLQLKRVILENYNAVIPYHAKELVMQLGQAGERDSEKCAGHGNFSRKLPSAPEYLQRRKRGRDRRKTGLNSCVRERRSVRDAEDTAPDNRSVWVLQPSHRLVPVLEALRVGSDSAEEDTLLELSRNEETSRRPHTIATDCPVVTKEEAEFNDCTSEAIPGKQLGCTHLSNVKLHHHPEHKIYWSTNSSSLVHTLLSRIGALRASPSGNDAPNCDCPESRPLVKSRCTHSSISCTELRNDSQQRWKHGLSRLLRNQRKSEASITPLSVSNSASASSFFSGFGAKSCSSSPAPISRNVKLTPSLHSVHKPGSSAIGARMALRNSHEYVSPCMLLLKRQDTISSCSSDEEEEQPPAIPPRNHNILARVTNKITISNSEHLSDSEDDASSSGTGDSYYERSFEEFEDSLERAFKDTVIYSDSEDQVPLPVQTRQKKDIVSLYDKFRLKKFPDIRNRNRSESVPSATRRESASGPQVCNNISKLVKVELKSCADILGKNNYMNLVSDGNKNCLPSSLRWSCRIRGSTIQKRLHSLEMTLQKGPEGSANNINGCDVKCDIEKEVGESHVVNKGWVRHVIGKLQGHSSS